MKKFFQATMLMTALAAFGSQEVRAQVASLTEVGAADPRASGPADFLEICHYQAESGSWQLLTLPLEDVGAHLANHDDGLPGQTTSVSGAVLDARCEEVEWTEAEEIAGIRMRVHATGRNAPQSAMGGTGVGNPGNEVR